MVRENMIISHLKKIASDLESPWTDLPDEHIEITFAPGIRVGFHVDADSHMLKGEALLGPLPIKKRQETIHELMKANVLGKEVGNYALGLCADGESIVLVGFFPTDFEESEFRRGLEQFLNYAEAWMVSVGI